MNIQIFGTKKCKDTKKAERFFKERNIKFQLVNLVEKELSKGEFNSVKAAVGGAENMIDTNSAKYKKKLQFLNFDAEEEIAEDPSILKTPIVRNGKKATIGYAVEVWTKWVKEE